MEDSLSNLVSISCMEAEIHVYKLMYFGSMADIFDSHESPPPDAEEYIFTLVSMRCSTPKMGSVL